MAFEEEDFMLIIIKDRILAIVEYVTVDKTVYKFIGRYEIEIPLMCVESLFRHNTDRIYMTHPKIGHHRRKWKKFRTGPLSVGVLPLPVSLGIPFTPPAVMTTYKRQDPQPVLPTIRVLRVLPLILRTQPHRILPVDPLQGLPEKLLREPVHPRVHLR